MKEKQEENSAAADAAVERRFFALSTECANKSPLLLLP